jgi:hypothetical protein
VIIVVTTIEQMWRSYTTNTTAARLGWGGLCAASLIFVDTNHHGELVVIPAAGSLVRVHSFGSRMLLRALHDVCYAVFATNKIKK